MRVIRLCKYRMIRRLSYLLIGLILIVASAAVFADKPPKTLFEHVTKTSKLVHSGTCNVAFIKKNNVECLIFYSETVLWLVLFDLDKQGAPQVTHVIAVVDEKEQITWCRADVCT